MHSLPNRFQSGFRPFDSKTTALIKITDDIRWPKDERMITLIILLDFSNAFNCVDADISTAIVLSLNLS